MGEPRRPDVESMIYGLALVVALIAGTAAIYDAMTDDPAEEGAAAATTPGATTDAPTPPVRVPTSDEVGGVEIVQREQGTSRAGPDFVPDLPEVPDLATEPPPPRRESDDPRMEQLGAEMRILSRARDLLADHPSEALGVLRQHRRAFPDGVLREEREAFAVEALLALEHVAEAERRYYEFRRDFPESDFGDRLEELMQRPPHEVGAGGR